MKRVVMQNAITPELAAAVEAAAKKLGLDPNDKDNARRLFRSVVAIAAARLLNDGAPPLLVANEAVRAVIDEVESRANAAVAQGNPFGLPAPASA